MAKHRATKKNKKSTKKKGGSHTPLTRGALARPRGRRIF